MLGNLFLQFLGVNTIQHCIAADGVGGVHIHGGEHIIFSGIGIGELIIVRTEFIRGIVHSRDAAVVSGLCGCIAFARIERKEISHINGGVFVQIFHSRCSGKGQFLHGNKDGVAVGSVRCLILFTLCLHRQHIGNEQNILHRG